METARHVHTDTAKRRLGAEVHTIRHGSRRQHEKQPRAPWRLSERDSCTDHAHAGGSARGDWVHMRTISRAESAISGWLHTAGHGRSTTCGQNRWQLFHIDPRRCGWASGWRGKHGLSRSRGASGLRGGLVMSAAVQRPGMAERIKLLTRKVRQSCLSPAPKSTHGESGELRSCPKPVARRFSESCSRSGGVNHIRPITKLAEVWSTSAKIGRSGPAVATTDQLAEIHRARSTCLGPLWANLG